MATCFDPHLCHLRANIWLTNVIYVNYWPEGDLMWVERFWHIIWRSNSNINKQLYQQKLYMNLYNKVVLFSSLNVHFVETLRDTSDTHLPCLFKHIWLYIQNCLAIVEYFFLVLWCLFFCIYICFREFGLRPLLYEYTKNLRSVHTVAAVVHTNSPVKRVEDLKGKRACFSVYNGVGEYEATAKFVINVQSTLLLSLLKTHVYICKCI